MANLTLVHIASLVTAGSHTIAVPATTLVAKGGWGLVNYAFGGWNDGSMSLSKTVDVETVVYVSANYIRTQNFMSHISRVEWNKL